MKELYAQAHRMSKQIREKRNLRDAESAVASNIYLIQVPKLEMANLIPVRRAELAKSDIITEEK